MAAEVSSGSTFLTGTSDEEDKAKRLAALRSAADPEEAMKSPGEALLGSMMGDALAQVVQDAAQQEAARKKASGIEEGRAVAQTMHLILVEQSQDSGSRA